LVFALLPDYIQKGYGLEIAIATLYHATKELLLPETPAITLPSNKASIRLLKNAGMQYKKEIVMETTGETHLYFSMVPE
jgi:RimJ/RimL family protein N-acetyltransferase